jgi:tRNA-dihydrouridine synthase C
MKLILAPMEGLLDFTLRDILTRVGGVDGCVSEFIRITDQLLPGAGVHAHRARASPRQPHPGRCAGAPAAAGL